MARARTATKNTIKGVNKALKALTPAAAERMREASQALAGEVAERASGFAREGGSQGPLIAPHIKAKRDRIPVVQMGSTRKLPARNGITRKGKRQTIAELVNGWNFGSKRFTQFPPVIRGGDRALFKSLKGHGREIRQQYADALLDAIDDSLKATD